MRARAYLVAGTAALMTAAALQLLSVVQVLP